MTANSRTVGASNDQADLIYRPHVDIEAFRKSVVECALIPYDRIEGDTIVRAELEEFVEKGWRRHGQYVTTLHAPFSWKLEHRSLTFHLNSWEPFSRLLAGAEKFDAPQFFDFSYRAIIDWLQTFQRPALDLTTYGELDGLIGKKEDFVWYDMGVGFRCYRIAYVLDVASRQKGIPMEHIELLLRSLYFHHEALTRDFFFRGHNNHGLYQALGQLAAARRFLNLPKMREYAEVATMRVRRLINQHFFASGVHKEHSPAYHYMLLNSFLGARNAGLLTQPDISSKLADMEEALSWMIMPDTGIVPIGDSDARPRRRAKHHLAELKYANPSLNYVLSHGKIGESPTPGVRVYDDAGYVFARMRLTAEQPFNRWSYLAQMAGFHSRTHKHADHLSFVWCDGGRPILIDAGRYGYGGRTEPGSALAKDGFWYSDPNRVYVESTCAHNTVEIDGKNFPRVNVKPFGSAITYAGECDGMAVTDCCTIQFGTVRHRRILCMRPARFLLVIDHLEDPTGHEHRFVQRFLFAPDIPDDLRRPIDAKNREGWRVASEKDGYLATLGAVASRSLHVRSLVEGVTPTAVVCGQTEPRMLGWYSNDANSILPACSVGYLKEGVSSATFATLFAFGSEVVAAPSQQRFAPDLSAADLSWTADGRTLNLKLFDDGGKISARFSRIK